MSEEIKVSEWADGEYEGFLRKDGTPTKDWDVPRGSSPIGDIIKLRELGRWDVPLQTPTPPGSPGEENAMFRGWEAVYVQMVFEPEMLFRVVQESMWRRLLDEMDKVMRLHYKLVEPANFRIGNLWLNQLQPGANKTAVWYAYYRAPGATVEPQEGRNL